MPTERLHQRKPYESFGLTEKEAIHLRVSDERLKEILDNPNTSTHTISLNVNTFGEFLFITTSKGIGQQRIYVTFYGLGYHEYRERWISKEWYWYQAQESTVDIRTKKSREEVIEKIEQRFVEISPRLSEATQTELGHMFEYLADLTDDDAALAEMQDLGLL